jgi:hypothetical protein
LLAIAIVILSLVPASLRPVTNAPHGLEHFTIFAVTGFMFSVGYGRRYGILVIALLIFAGAIEVDQLFAPGRHPRQSNRVSPAASAAEILNSFVPAWQCAEIGLTTRLGETNPILVNRQSILTDRPRGHSLRRSRQWTD